MRPFNICTSAIIASLASVMFLVSIEFASRRWMGISANSQTLAGAGVFARKCARCHGVERTDPASIGPSLAELYLRAAGNDQKLSAVDYVYRSIVYPAELIVPGYSNTMPRVANDLNDDELRSLVAFLLRGKPARHELERLQLPIQQAAVTLEFDSSRDQIALGKSLYFGKGRCHACHSMHGRSEYSIAAPTLFWRGLHDRTSVTESIRTPDAAISDGYGDVLCMLQSGKSLSGRVVKISPQRIDLLSPDVNGQWGVISIASEDLDEEFEHKFDKPRSPMPSASASSLTEQDIEAIVHFITSLN